MKGTAKKTIFKCLCVLLAALLLFLLFGFGNGNVRLTRTDGGMDSGTIQLQLRNWTGRSIAPGHPLLYVETENGVEPVPFVKSVSWTLDFLILKFPGSMPVTVPVREWYGNLPQGKYQVRMDYRLLRWLTMEQIGTRTAVYSFTVH